ncbi:response regulator transcription factor [Streptococcus equi]|uniref:response regulator transcription factor n=1 Tax=Streptococcus equi TaxID=1336 RepID=UPI0013F5CEC1|nr:response regulator transcription factor [Streptococcus equi]HEK9107237.1 response regulator transcription factor [Streptococcus equi subsp. zooepidemicus]
MKHILVVEDDPIINQVICEFLKENKYQVTSVFDGQDALDQVASADFDLLILDIMLPSVNGIDVLKRVRQTSQVPIMMLTAVDDEYTQLVSFNHLISDYVVKPFSPLILMKRVENILRQEVQKSSSDSLYHLDYDNSALVYEEERIILTKKEYAILTVLIKYQGRLVTREQLMNTVWGYSELDSRVLDNHIKNIRKKCPQLPLQTMTGMGYKLGEG